MFNLDNIVGIMFVISPELLYMTMCEEIYEYTVESIDQDNLCKITWKDGCTKNETKYKATDVVEFLNEGSWKKCG